MFATARRPRCVRVSLALPETNWNQGSLVGEYLHIMIERIHSSSVTLVRGLRSSPWLFITAVITLAAAAGMNIAMVGLVDRALLSPPGHVTVPERLFAVGFDHRRVTVPRS